MTEKEYRQHPAISRSELWLLNRSPEYFKYRKEHPIEPTPAMLFGQVAHKLLLQPDDFETDFIIAPDIDRRTKTGKEAWSEFLDAAADRSIVPYDMYETASMMAEKAMSEPLVRKLLAGQKEQPFFWTDDDTGEMCKCRVDCLTLFDGDEMPTVIDYKTTSNAKTDIFNNEIFKYGYHFQSAMYCDGVRKCLNLPELPPFIIIAQEKTPPFSLNVVTMPREVVLAGYDKFREFIGIYHECKTTGYWYSYTGALNEPNEAFLPGWMQLGTEEDE